MNYPACTVLIVCWVIVDINLPLASLPSCWDSNTACLQALPSSPSSSPPPSSSSSSSYSSYSFSSSSFSSSSSSILFKASCLSSQLMSSHSSQGILVGWEKYNDTKLDLCK